MLQNITGSPRTTIVAILISLFAAASALGGVAGLPATVTQICGGVVTVAGIALGLFGVDPTAKALRAALTLRLVKDATKDLS